jgi:hypothetical protein
VNLKPSSTPAVQNILKCISIPRVHFLRVVLMHEDKVTFTILSENLVRWFGKIGHSYVPPPKSVPAILSEAKSLGY